MREKLATLGLDSPEHEGLGALAAGTAGPEGCASCVAELEEAGRAFVTAFGNRDYESFIGFFYDENATGLGADGTMGLNRDAWGRILREYFIEETWKLAATPVKTVVQQCNYGQILEIVRFDSAEMSITFVHVTVWLRKHGQWRVVLQTEAGPIEDADAVLQTAQQNLVVTP
ncbi:hypothetical protein ACFXPR_00790 [Nocardia tengchongensis]|uniref:hypothetical protein n=1 Tax=Nocardia tengchongensis TaxID=2055889 RepID=UPI00367F4344